MIEPIKIGINDDSLFVNGNRHLTVNLARPESEPKTPLGGRLRAVRRHFGDETRQDFARSLNISKDALALYERGENAPAAPVLATYHDRFGIDLNWLLTGLGEMFADPTKAPQPENRPIIYSNLFREVCQIVLRIHSDAGVKLPPLAALDEQSAAYNALIERAEDPADQAELQSLLPWLENQLKKKLRSATSEPGTGKHEA